MLVASTAHDASATQTEAINGTSAVRVNSIAASNVAISAANNAHRNLEIRTYSEGSLFKGNMYQLIITKALIA